MPLYEYSCDECEHKFDHVSTMVKCNEPLLEPCPYCGENGTVYRIYSTGGVVSAGILKADKNMEDSGVQANLERIRENHPKSNMKWKG